MWHMVNAQVLITKSFQNDSMNINEHIFVCSAFPFGIVVFHMFLLANLLR